MTDTCETAVVAHDATTVPVRSRVVNGPCPRVQLLRNWFVQRRKLMPTEEELELATKYRAQMDRQRARARRAKQAEEEAKREEEERVAMEELRAAGWDEAVHGTLTPRSAMPIFDGGASTPGGWQSALGDFDNMQSIMHASRPVSVPRSAGSRQLHPFFDIHVQQHQHSHTGIPKGAHWSVAASSRNTVQCLSELPLSILHRVYEFVAVIEPRLFDDLEQLMRILGQDDAMLIHEPLAATELLEQVDGVFREHCVAYGASCTVGLPLNVDRRAQDCTSDTVLGPLCPHGQRELYGRHLYAVNRELRFLRAREKQIAAWWTFKRAILDRPCSVIRETVRDDMARWRSIVNDWKDQRHDVPALLIEAELNSLQDRVRAVEFIGDPSLEVDDARNLFWEAGLKPPEGVTPEYMQSITFGQAISLGIIDVHWVRGYTWEERPLDERARAATGDSSGARTTALHQSMSNAGLDGSTTSTAPNGVDLRTVAERRADEEAIAAQQRLEATAHEATIEADKERAVKFDRAREVAAQGMTQRVWKRTEPRRPRWSHQFGGCELCASVPVHVVGLKKPNSGADADIALCQTCYDGEYKPVAVLRNMYEWCSVADIIDRSGEFSGIEAAASRATPAEAVP
jgi:hypothetical protein